MFKKIALFFSLIAAIQVTKAQNIGDWRLHFGYENAVDIAYSDQAVYSATVNSLLVYALDDGEIRLLDEANALSDIGISNIDYSKEMDALIIAYNSSNIDVLQGNTLTNVPDILNKLSAGSKKINEIFIDSNLAYLSTDFGLVVLDIENKEIDNTFVIGSTGDPVIVADCSIQDGTIYALTAQGLKSAPTNSNNLLDFNSWNHNIANLPSGNIQFIENFEDKLYAVANEKLYLLNDGVWDSIFHLDEWEFQSLQASEKLCFSLYAAGLQGDGRRVYTSLDGIQFDTVALTTQISPDGALTAQGITFVRDRAIGLLRHENTTQRIFPFGLPTFNNAFSASSFGNRVFVASGGFNRNVDPLNIYQGFYFIEDNVWRNVNQFNTPGYTGIQDLNSVAQNPFDSKVYASSANGLLEYDFNTVTLYNRDNSPIDSVIGNGSFDMITSLDFDSRGNVWFLNSLTSEPLLVKTNSGEFYEFAINSAKYNRIFVDSYDQKWIMLRNSGITVFKEEDLGSSNAFQTVTISGANLPNSTVNTIVEDKNGEIWIGTDEGVAVFDCPEDVFDPTTTCKTARRIKATLDDVFSATEFLFETDVVRAIAVDGANRKWVGTEAGLWLLNETGEEEILKFNVDNSPLPSNKITDIAINESTGEVFITTELGLASYFSDATEPSENHDEIKAYPNPVRPDYNGFISITGLVDGAFIKITDNAGVLIDEGFALGGKYIWDGKDYNGRKGKTGVYYVFSSNPDGSEKAVTKIAFIN